MLKTPLRVGILISGSGTTMESILNSCQRGILHKLINPVVVISSKSNAQGLIKAKKYQIPTEVISSEFDTQQLAKLTKYRVDLVSQNGWLPKTPASVVNYYKDRIINQHPGPLDPGRSLDFGGKDMYGSRVVCARLAYLLLSAETSIWTESTVHFVTPQYDKGDLISTAKLSFSLFKHPPILQNYLLKKTAQIQKKLLLLEHKNVINALKLFALGKVKGFRRKKILIPKKNEKYLKEAKELSIKLFAYG